LLYSDPLEFVHRYEGDAWDQEAVALLAALLAYGNVRQIRASVEDALGRIARGGWTPAGFVRTLSERGPALAEEVFRGWTHRFNVGEDLALLFWLLGRSWREHGSLGAHFLRGLEPGAPDIGPALDRLIHEWRAWRTEFPAAPLGRDSFAYLLTAPGDGSCCKRWCMLLRWMGRKDGLDPGLWTENSPLASGFLEGRFLRAAQLVLPLDTHTGRISRYIGLTRRKTLGWKAALEITARLAKADPADPVRFDFALSRLGILDLCQKKFRVEICGRCALLPACRFARRRRARKSPLPPGLPSGVGS
jgi:uncharacterized protein (TIGR02757 family)